MKKRKPTQLSFDFSQPKRKKRVKKATKKAVASAASKKPITTPSGAGYALVKSKSHCIKSIASAVLNKWRWKKSKKRK